MANTPKVSTNEAPLPEGFQVGTLLEWKPANWEYMILGIAGNYPPQTQALLNGYGAEGWEVVGINPHRPELILKRQKIEVADGADVEQQ